MGQVGTSWNELERVGISWEPEKLQNFTLKKTSGEERKKERKKKNIGYRVASNERRLKIGLTRNLLDSVKKILGTHTHSN